MWIGADAIELSLMDSCTNCVVFLRENGCPDLNKMKKFDKKFLTIIICTRYLKETYDVDH